MYVVEVVRDSSTYNLHFFFVDLLLKERFLNAPTFFLLQFG